MSLTPVVRVSLLQAESYRQSRATAIPAEATTTAAAPVLTSSTILQDLAALFKALASGSVVASEAALATVTSDIAEHTSSSSNGTLPDPTASALAALNALLETMRESLAAKGTDAALQDLAAYVIQNVPASGKLVNTTV